MATKMTQSALRDASQKAPSKSITPMQAKYVIPKEMCILPEEGQQIIDGHRLI